MLTFLKHIFKRDTPQPSVTLEPVVVPITPVPKDPPSAKRSPAAIPMPNAALAEDVRIELASLKQRLQNKEIDFATYKRAKTRIEGCEPYALKPTTRPMQPLEDKRPIMQLQANPVETSTVSTSRQSIDHMSGIEFESYCSQELRNSGWDTELTKASGDQGLDILAKGYGLKVAIQCKRYTGPIGNWAVQEIYAAKDYYDADFAVVAGSSVFTVQAQTLARKLGVRLIHHSELGRLKHLL